MLSWLRKLLGRNEMPPPAPPRAVPGVRVDIDDTSITVAGPDGAVKRLPWADLASVTILTTDEGPFETDLYWLLQGRHRHHGILVPLGAAGEHELLKEMQRRLAGFDNMVVVEAMSSTGNAEFTAWEARSPDRGTRP
jgi:hypothetical protein